MTGERLTAEEREAIEREVVRAQLRRWLVRLTAGIVLATVLGVLAALGASTHWLVGVAFTGGLLVADRTS